MSKEEKTNPTPSELEILQFLWKHGPSTVKQIHEELEKSKEVRYTTTLKTMQVMFERGMLQREAQGRKHIYQAAIAEDETQDVLLDRFLNKTFRGSALKLVMRALGNYDATQSDLNQLKDYIDQMEKTQKK
ncbi:MAG: BlaI/MecI/CopY family transcriptional regulator [Saprospiraceae bacterium]|nr:BlaI/MecI/CopY family transcriptional regulator [Saprospiraceae bacterium]